jgi:hypothetical protein
LEVEAKNFLDKEDVVELYVTVFVVAELQDYYIMEFDRENVMTNA